jgi:hypothetical protein
MNDSSGYIKKLQKWATQLGLAARLFYITAGNTRAGGFTSSGDDNGGGGGGGGGGSGVGGGGGGCKGPPGGGRVEGVYVVLGGDGDAVQGFLTRWGGAR